MKGAPRCRVTGAEFEGFARRGMVGPKSGNVWVEGVKKDALKQLEPQSPESHTENLRSQVRFEGWQLTSRGPKAPTLSERPTSGP